MSDPAVSIETLQFENATLRRQVAQLAEQRAQLDGEAARLATEVLDARRELAEAGRRLAELDRLQDEFMPLFSHELRTPVANIKLYLHLLEQGQPEKWDAYLHTLDQEAERLSHLVESLLDVSRLSLNKIEVRSAPLDATALLHDLITNQAAQALERGLTLTALSTPDHPTLTTDRDLLRRALGKVLTNALNYTPPGGTITLRADRAATPNGEWVTVEVRDTGPGLSEQDREHLFELFYRGAAARSYKAPGIGVGLFIAQRLIDLLGGRITVEPQPGQGAAFTVRLPATD